MRNYLLFTIFAVSINALAQIPTTGLVGYYPFNNNANDESGNGYNGIVYGAILAQDRFGNENSAYSFDGVNDYIETNINSGFTNEITISVWMKTNHTFLDYDPGIVAQRNSTYDITGIDLTNTNKAVFYLDKTGSGSANVNPPIVINDNIWHLLVGTYDGNYLKIYIDNVLLSTLQVTSIIEMSSSFRIGNDYEPTPPARFFNGYIDDVRIYNLALESSDVELLYNEESCYHDITIQPQDQTVSVCSQANFNINTSGSSPLTYQWHKNGMAISGAIYSSYVTPILTLEDDGNTYYCEISFCQGQFEVISNTATLTVIPPCLYSLPGVMLDKSTLIAGESLNITGSNFTPYGIINLSIKDESGQAVGVDIPIAYINPGIFEFVLPITTSFMHGQYTVVATDVSTGNSASTALFFVNNLNIPTLEITNPSINSTIFRNKTFDIEWKDYVSSAPVNGPTGELLKTYKIEASIDNGGFWNHIGTRVYKADAGKINPFSFSYSVTTFGPYIFRVSDFDNPSNTATSSSITAIDCDSGGFIASLEWDATVPTDVKSKKSFPYGLAADGTARLLLRLKRINETPEVSTIQATIQTVGPNYSGTALLGKIAHISSNEFNSTSISYPAAFYNNSNADNYWFWLVAPDDFTTDPNSEEKYREINVEFNITYTDNTTELISFCRPISICRPALVFAHGLAGTFEAFKYTGFNNNNGDDDISYFSQAIDIWKEVKLLDLKGLGSYQVNADILLGKEIDETKTTSENSINSILKRMHFYGYANKRIDYVAHSMGGAVGRTLINNGGCWFSPGVHQLRNYGNGYINKYISICTPHNGSPIADLAVDAFNVIIFLGGLNSLTAPFVGAVLAKSYFEDLGFVYKGSISQAIANLQFQSGGIQHTETTVKNHLISADVDEDNDTPEDDIIDSINTSDSFGKGMSILFKVLNKIPNVHDFFSIIYGSSAYLSNSDLIVPLSSQLAGKPESSALDISTNTTDVSQTSIIYGPDKQHVGIQNNLCIGNRLKVLLNAQMTSGYFDDMIPAYSVNQNTIIGNDSEIDSRSRIICMDTGLTYVDTIKIRISSPLTNDTLYIDSTLQISIKVKDTSGLENLRVLYKSSFFYSSTKDSVQLFQTTISPSDLGSNMIIAVAQYDSMGCPVYYIDTVTINVITLDSLEGFYITPIARHLNPDQDFVPNYHVVYPTYIGELRPGADSLTFMILDTNVVVYDSVYHDFVSKDTGSTHIVFSYGGLSDTMFIYISTSNIDNVLSICPFDSISIWSGVIDTTKAYQWQVDTLDGFADIFDNIYYSGTDSSILNIINPPPNWYDYKYRCIISDPVGATESDVFTLRFGLVWTGAIDTTWENPDNWNCEILPDSNTDVIIPSSSPHFPTVNSNASCRSLRIQPGAMIEVKTGFQLNTTGGVEE